MSQIFSNQKNRHFELSLIIFFLIVSASIGMSAERWDKTVIPNDNFALQYVPVDAARIERRIKQIWKEIPRDRNQKFDSDVLSEPGFSEGLGKLLDFYCLAYIYFLEGKDGDKVSPFGLARGKPDPIYRKEYEDFDRLMRAWKIDPPVGVIGGITDTLERLNDERALPILARVYFFTANYVPMGDDSGYSPPSAYVEISTLLEKKKPELLASMPKAGHTKPGKNHSDEMRTWILANKATLLPDGVPKSANVQEAPFLDYIAKQEAALLAAPLEGANNESPNERRDKMVAVWIGVGALLLLLLAWTIRKVRSKRQAT